MFLISILAGIVLVYLLFKDVRIPFSGEENIR